MRSLIFRPGVTCCRADGRLILLDVPADRYFALTASAEDAMLTLIAQEPLNAHQGEVIGSLIARGLLLETADEARSLLCPTPPLPSESMLDRPLPRSPWSSTLHAATVWLSVRVRLRMLGLATTLRSLKRLTARSSTEWDRSVAAEVVAGFVHAGALMSAFDQCLSHSIAVAMMLARRGVRANLIIGVQITPFRAHSWVQHGALVINDRVDTVRPFTPILVQ